MKLVEILAKKLDVWPTGAAIAVQDGDARKTVKFGSKHANPSIALMGLKDVWQARDWEYTHQSDFDHSSLASDWKTAIVTKKHWQAERDRQTGGEWKRHRGGKCPVDSQTVVEIRQRNGDIEKFTANGFMWDHNGQKDDIMSYRVISQPQAEEVEMIHSQESLKRAEINLMGITEGTFTQGPISLDNEVIYPAGPEWHTNQIDGPIKWRDTVNELDAYIEEFTREREALINRLALEGFALIEKINLNLDKIDATLDMSDWRNWKVGDLVTSKVDYNHQFTKGKKYKVTGTNMYLGEKRVSVESDDKGKANGWLANQFEFHSRP